VAGERQLLDYPEGRAVLNSRRRRQQGMSLIELMVGVALAALLLMLSLPSFVTGMQNRQIRTATDAIQNGLVTARTEALRRNRVVKFQLVAASGWSVGCDPEDTTIVDGQENCPALIQARPAGEGSPNAAVATVQIAVASGTPAAGAVFTDTLRFTSLGRLTDNTLPAGNNAVFQVSNPTGGACVADGGEMRCLSVVVTPSGQIRMCDPAVLAGDPRAC
jgi:type IV fimbrial biogenesis protein FimT